MTSENEKETELRERRLRIIESRKRNELRAAYGLKLVSVLSETTGAALSLADFKIDSVAPYALEWPRRISDAPGLVAAYVSRAAVSDLLNCLDREFGALNGQIGFHDKTYLGLARIAGVHVTALASAAEASEDSVILYVEDPQGVILVDFYRSPPGDPFSVVIQGEELVQRSRRGGCGRFEKR